MLVFTKPEPSVNADSVIKVEAKADPALSGKEYDVTLRRADGTGTQQTLKNADHTTNSVWTKSGETAPKSRFMSSVDDVQATFDAAEYADAHGLWNGNKAKVFVEDGYVGVLGNGEPTQWIAVSRTETGFIHGWPCSPPH